jgi:hypothetical protein
MSGCANMDSSGQRASIPASVKTIESNVARQGYFYVGGRYVGEPGREAMVGQMYVEVWAPREVRHPWQRPRYTVGAQQPRRGGVRQQMARRACALIEACHAFISS